MILGLRGPGEVVGEMSAFDGAPRTATALAGFHFHLVKPIDTPTLRAALDRFRELTRRPPPFPSSDE